MGKLNELILHINKGKLTRFCDINNYFERNYKIRVEIGFLPTYEIKEELIPFTVESSLLAVCLKIVISVIPKK